VAVRLACAEKVDQAMWPWAQRTPFHQPVEATGAGEDSVPSAEVEQMEAAPERVRSKSKARPETTLGAMG